MAYGGDDALTEAPSVYAALDVLAVRARRCAVALFNFFSVTYFV